MTWGRCPHTPGVYRLEGIWRGRKKERQSVKPCPSVIPRHGARVALQQSPILRTDKKMIASLLKRS